MARGKPMLATFFIVSCFFQIYTTNCAKTNVVGQLSEIRKEKIILALGDVLNGLKDETHMESYKKFREEIAEKIHPIITKKGVKNDDEKRAEISKILRIMKMERNLDGRIGKAFIGIQVKNAKQKLMQNGKERKGKEMRQNIRDEVMAILRREWPEKRRLSAHLVKAVNFAIQRECGKKLWIAEISSPFVSTPPRGYAGTQRIVSYLTEELVRRGHRVTLYATSDSATSGKKLIANSPSLNSIQFPTNDAFLRSFDVQAKWLMDEVRQGAHKFDIVHFHTHFAFDKMCAIGRMFRRSPIMMTLHNLLSRYPELCQEYNQIPLVSISNDQRTHAPEGNEGNGANFIGTVYNGIPRNLYKFVETPAPPDGHPYLAFMGRFAEFKRPDWAIEIAVRAGIRLKIAAKMPRPGTGEHKFYEEKIQPMLEEHGEMVEYVGEINDEQKSDFLGNAIAFLFPISWPEPFGIVMIEAMACGTPVLTQPNGAIPEVIEEGTTGLLFQTIDEAVVRVGQVGGIDRAGVRAAFERRFTVETMADGYEEIFYEIAGKTRD